MPLTNACIIGNINCFHVLRGHKQVSEAAESNPLTQTHSLHLSSYCSRLSQPPSVLFGGKEHQSSLHEHEEPITGALARQSQHHKCLNPQRLLCSHQQNINRHQDWTANTQMNYELSNHALHAIQDELLKPVHFVNIWNTIKSSRS